VLHGDGTTIAVKEDNNLGYGDHKHLKDDKVRAFLGQEEENGLLPIADHVHRKTHIKALSCHG